MARYRTCTSAYSLTTAHLSAQTVVRGARVALVATGLWAMRDYWVGNPSAEQAGHHAMCLAMVVLVAAPGHRAANVLGFVALWLTVGEFIAAGHAGQFALWRWAVVLGNLGVTLILIRVPRFRALTRANPWRALGEGASSHAGDRSLDKNDQSSSFYPRFPGFAAIPEPPRVPPDTKSLA